MWDLPGPGIEAVPPAPAGSFLTTAPPGKPSILSLKGNDPPHLDEALLRTTQPRQPYATILLPGPVKSRTQTDSAQSKSHSR